MDTFWFRIGQTSATLALLSFSFVCLAGECPALMKFAGVCTGMRIAEIKALKNVSLSPEHGGRGCDYYDADIAYKRSHYSGVLGFSGRKGVLNSYSLKISHEAADNLMSALSIKYGPPSSSDVSGNGVVSERKWRVQSIEATVKKIPNEAWIEYVDNRFKCDSNIEY